MARTMSVPCRRDLACYRNDGHPGECMYPTSSGHVHKGEWCEACVQHGVTLAATPATMVALCGAVLTCALPILHDGDHERADGIRWTWPATPAPLDVLVAAKVPEDPDSVMAWALLGVGAFTVKDDSGEVCTMVLGSRNNVAARLDNWFAHHPDFDLVLPAPLGRCEVCHWVGGQEERP